MVESDIDYIKNCLSAGLIQSPCLELGVGYSGPNNKDLLKQVGIKYFGTDVMPGNHVDYVIDFEDSIENIEKAIEFKRFGSILALSILEHAFDPIRILDNIFNLLQEGGTCIIITPTVWPLHDYPIDCWRINPNFYEEYCKRNSLTLIDDHFEYVGFHHVKENTARDGSYVLPTPSPETFKSLRSKIVHKIFDTFGRGMLFPSHIATGAVIKKPK